MNECPTERSCAIGEQGKAGITGTGMKETEGMMRIPAGTAAGMEEVAAWDGIGTTDRSH